MDRNSLIAEFAQQVDHIADDRRMVAISAAIACLILMWIAVPLRFVARWCSASRFGLDDWMIACALFMSTAFVIDTALSFWFGGGQHAILLLADYNKMETYIKNSLANEVLFMPTLMAIKVSILLLYGRLFPVKSFHRMLWAVGTFIGLYTIGSTVVCLIQCMPLSHLWEIFKPGTCLDVMLALTVFGALNVVTNVVVLALPIPMIWRLHTSRTVKLQITALFLTGAFDMVISIVRTYYISQIRMLDPTWTETDPIAWTTAEVAVAMICACLPTYRPLFDKSVRKSARKGGESSHQSEYKTNATVATPTDLECGSFSRIIVETRIENTWDEHYQGSESPIPEDVWSDERCMASRSLSRSQSMKKLNPTTGGVWHGLSRSTSKRKLDPQSEKECS